MEDVLRGERAHRGNEAGVKPDQERHRRGEVVHERAGHQRQVDVLPGERIHAGVGGHNRLRHPPEVGAADDHPPFHEQRREERNHRVGTARLTQQGRELHVGVGRVAAGPGGGRGELDLRRVRRPGLVPRERNHHDGAGRGRRPRAELAHEPTEMALRRQLVPEGGDAAARGRGAGERGRRGANLRQRAHPLVDGRERLLEEGEPRVPREDARHDDAARIMPVPVVFARGRDATAEPRRPAPVALGERERVRHLARRNVRPFLRGVADRLGEISLREGEVLGVHRRDELAIVLGAVAAVGAVGGADARAGDDRPKVIARAFQAHDQEGARHRARHGGARAELSLPLD